MLIKCDIIDTRRKIIIRVFIMYLNVVTDNAYQKITF